MIEKDSLYKLINHFNGKSSNKKMLSKIRDLEETKRTEIVYQSKLQNSYYRDDNYKKVPIKVKIEYSRHAYERVAFRELDRRNLESAIKDAISSLFRLGDRIESDFKIYSYKYFTVIPGVVYFDKDRSLMRVIIKTAFSSPKPSWHKNEKLIYV
jgi:hypothetical protein